MQTATARTTKAPYVQILANGLKWTAAIVVGWWMQAPSAMHALLALMLLDIVTGFVAGCVNGDITSGIMRKGFLRKLLTIIVLLTCHVIEQAAGVELHLETIGAFAYCVNETISILENANRAGVPIPREVLAILLATKQLRRTENARPDDWKKLED